MERPLPSSLLKPQSIAVIGASETPGKAAERRTRSLIEGGFEKDIYLVNPNRETIFGRACYKSLQDVPTNKIDVALIILPPNLVLAAIKDCATKKVETAIIITAGLRRADEGSSQVEQEILDVAKQNNIRIVGPNCSGLFIRDAQLNLLGIPDITQGPISVISQSGNVIDSIIAHSQRRNLGFRHIFSVGNALDTTATDYLELIKNDSQTRVVLMYLEHIANGEQFLEIAKEIISRVPIVALKVGRTATGIRATMSHTGSLADNDRVVQSAFEQFGIISVDSISELYFLGAALSTAPTPSGSRVAILSEGGGDNAVAADALDKRGLDIPCFSKELQRQISSHLLQDMACNNPVDYGGVAEEDPTVISNCVRECIESDEVDAVFITGFYGGFSEFISSSCASGEIEAAKEIISLTASSKKPVVIHSSFANSDSKAIALLLANGIPVSESSESAADILAALVRLANARKRLEQRDYISPDSKNIESAANGFLDINKLGRCNLLESESNEFFRRYKMPVLESHLLKSSEDLLSTSDSFSYPIAMKIVSADIVHKSDSGGVILDVRDKDQALGAFEQLISNALEVTSRDRIKGVLVSPMAKPGRECIIGMFRDPSFGPVVLVGLGGIFVEILQDISLRVLPVSTAEIREMFQELLGYSYLAGTRGEKSVDFKTLEQTVEKIVCISMLHPEIKEIDCNPVITHESGISIVDSRIIIKER